MRRRSLATITAAVAALVLLTGLVATSPAANFTLVGRTFRATWASVTFETSGVSARCPLTLGGNFEVSAFAATARTRIGNVSSASLGACTGGSETILRESLPWAVQYSSFTGSLPEIRSVSFRLIGASFRSQPSGQPACLARSEEAEPLVATAERETLGVLTGIRFDETSTIRVTGEAMCSLVGRTRFAGSGRIQQSTIPREETEEINIYQSEDIGDVVVIEDAGGPIVTEIQVRRQELAAKQVRIRNPGARPLHIVSVGFLEPNTERFLRLEAPAERCRGESQTVLTQNQECRIEIKSTSTTMDGVAGELGIVLQIGANGPVAGLKGRLRTIN